ncbi:MAG: hypothetical protein SO023_07835, partial [Eubacterium sp.]|nr:hypothetical protein [Eubacterium sp.]
NDRLSWYTIIKNGFLNQRAVRNCIELADGSLLTIRHICVQFYSATAHMSMKRSGMRMALLETQQCDSTHEHEA